jgi:GrpB-like predicted nucleotidyltransferase (UPF0157 family)
VTDASDIATFDDSRPPHGESPYLPGYGPTTELSIVAYDPSWPAAYERLADLIRAALGPAVLALDHVGSTAVPGLGAKPIIDVDLTVPDGAAETSYVPPLEAAGFQLIIREPWWYGHRLLRLRGPACNLHVWSPSCPEAARHLIFRDWLRANPVERERYLGAKLAASEQAIAVAGSVEAYNSHKQAVIRQIYRRAFSALGLT